MLLTDAEIAALLVEPKTLKKGWRVRMKLRPKAHDAHSEAELEVQGQAPHLFTIRIRQAAMDPTSFSVILGFRVPNSNRIFRLRRYNGSHTHTNSIEGKRFTAFHVHEASERYQERGGNEEAFATPTDRYQDVWGALHCCLTDCHITDPDDPNQTLFPENGR